MQFFLDGHEAESDPNSLDSILFRELGNLTVKVNTEDVRRLLEEQAIEQSD